MWKFLNLRMRVMFFVKSLFRFVSAHVSPKHSRCEVCWVSTIKMLNSDETIDVRSVTVRCLCAAVCVCVY